MKQTVAYGARGFSANAMWSLTGPFTVATDVREIEQCLPSSASDPTDSSSTLVTAPNRCTSMWSGMLNGPKFGSILSDCKRVAGFPRGELARIIMMVQEHEADLQRSWDDYFAD